MKKVSYFLSLAMIVIGLSGNNASAQGRGHKNGHDRNNSGQHDRDNRDNRDRGNDKDKSDNGNRGNDWDKKDNDRGRNNDGHGRWDRGDNGNHYGHRKGDNRWEYDRNRRDNRWERRDVRHYHHTHDRYCGHTIVVHQARPRYIYYRDYDVYYDCHRSVYISYSGRSWTMSAALPFTMRHVNVRTANRFEVDYWDDNLPVYLERRRPTCDRVYYGG